MNWSAADKVNSSKAILKNGAGRTVAVFDDLAIALQCAAAMNLTDAKQRTDWLAEQAGYGRAKR